MTKSTKQKLISAIQQGETKRAISLIRTGADLNINDAQGYTALMWAI